MRIIIVDPALFTWPYNNALANGLVANGLQVEIVTKYLAPGEQGSMDPLLHQMFYPGLQKSLAKKLPPKLFLLAKGLLHIVGMLQLLIYLKQQKPDIIHFQWTPLAIIDRHFIPIIKRIAPTILTVHDSSPFNNNPSSSIQRIGVISIMNDFDHLIVHTEQARNVLQKYGIDYSKISCIPHGVLGMTIAPQQVSSLMATKIENDKIEILLFGKVKPYKGTDTLIRAIAGLPTPSRDRAHLRIVGKAEMDMEPLFNLAEELGVTSNITWDLRFIDDNEIMGMFEASDIIAMPYREIDASGVLMVALAVGRPIIASNIGLFKELLENDKHGALINPEDFESLSFALEKFISDDKLRLTAGKNVKELGNSIPSWKQIGQRTLDLYRNLMNTKSS